MKKKIIVITAVVVLLLTGGILTFYNICHSPFYTLKKLTDSIDNHDWNTFAKYVDISGLKGLDALSLKSSVESTGEPFGTVKMLTDLGKSNSGKIEVVPMGKLTVVRFWDQFGEYKVPSYREITFRSEGFHFVMISASDAYVEHRTRMIEGLYRDFVYVPIKERIDNSARISVIKVYEGCSNWIGGVCFNQLIMVERKIENLTDDVIKEIEYSFGPYVASKYVTDSVRIAPKSSIIVGKKRGWDFNPYIEDDVAFRNTKPDEFRIKINKIVFENGDTLNTFIGYKLDKIPLQKDVIAWGKEHNSMLADSLESWNKFYNSLK